LGGVAGAKLFAQEKLPESAINAGLAAIPLGGVALKAAIKAAPKITGAALGAAGGVGLNMGDTFSQQSRDNQSWRNPSPAERETNRQNQDKLRALGLYAGRSDGVIEPNGQTWKAIQALQAREEREAQRKIEEQRLQGRDREAAAREAEANAKKIENQRLENERVQREKYQAIADKKMTEANENASPTSKFVRTYAQPIGMAVGTLAGIGTGFAVPRGFSAVNKARVATGNKLLDLPAGASVDERVGALNHFAREGGAGTNRPYERDMATESTWKVGAKQPESHELYRLTPARIGSEGAVNALGMGLYGTEWYLSGQRLEEAKRVENAAHDAFMKSGTDIDMQRYNDAKDNVAFLTGMIRVGQLGALTHGVKSTQGTLMREHQLPKLNEYDALRGPLNRELRPAGSGGGPSPGSPGGSPQPPAGANAGHANAGQGPAGAGPAPQPPPPPPQPNPIPAGPQAQGPGPAGGSPGPNAGGNGKAAQNYPAPFATGPSNTPIPKRLQKQGYTMAGNPSNPNQTRVGGKWGPNLDDLLKQPKKPPQSKAPPKEESSAPKSPPPPEQNGKPPEKDPFPEPHDDTVPYGGPTKRNGRGASLDYRNNGLLSLKA
jgi:hypothetical protein